MSYDNRLYPPQFLTTMMPAFVKSQGCKIYFSISNNSLNNIVQVHATVTDQRNNLSVLSERNTGNYKTGNVIKLYNLYYDQKRQSEDKYFIEINNSDIKNGFKSNIFYKVQIRFSSKAITSVSDVYNQNNQQYFSEWSTVCLIRAMQQEPTLYFAEFPNNQKMTTLSTLELELNGYVEFYEGDQQKVNSFFVQLYDDSDNLIQESKEVKVNQYYNSDLIKYQFKSELQENMRYTLKVQILTNFYYSFPVPKVYFFEIAEPSSASSIDINIDPTVNEEIGRIKLHITSNSGESNLVNLMIKRTSSESNFKFWEEVHKISYTNDSSLNYIWYDRTIKSGVFYKYAVYALNSRKQRIGFKKMENPVMAVFNNILLLSHDKQLTVKFNPQISSFNYVVAQGKTDTIGSQYPFFRRNGNLYYREFSLSGTITHFMDIKDNLMQASRSDIYKDSTLQYESYNYDNNITPYEDYIYQREFRDKVIEFLYSDDVKLFRSTTQGNMLIKISNISFTPNETLGRMIYDFSCTCDEIDEASYKNILAYKIITDSTDFNNESELVNYNEYYGQIIRPDFNTEDINGRTYFNKNDNIIRLLYEKYKGLGVEKKDTFRIIEIQGLSYLRIEMIDQPYLINMDTMTEVTGSPNVKNTALGYIVYINASSIDDKAHAVFIPPTGKYEISDSNSNKNSDKNFNITTVFFPRNTKAIIDYKVKIALKEDFSKIPISLSTRNTIGQLFGTFNINDNVYKMIYSKYYFKKMFQAGSLGNQINELHELNVVRGVRITGREGLAFVIKDSVNEDIQYTYLNETGILEFYDLNSNIVMLRFMGYHLDEKVLTDEQIKKVLSGKMQIRHTEYAVIKKQNELLEIKDLNDSKYHINNIVVRYKNKDYIFYDQNWYEFENNIVKVPKIEAIVDYYAEIISKEYSYDQ